MEISFKAGLLALLILPGTVNALAVFPKDKLGEAELSCPLTFTPGKAEDRVNFDFEQPFDLSAAWGFSFEVRPEKLSDFKRFVALMRTGGRSRPSGWYVYRPIPVEMDDGWLRITLARKPASTLKAPAGFGSISCFRFTAYLQPGRMPSGFRFRRFRVLDKKPDDLLFDVHARTAAAADKVRAIPAKAGERRLAWTHVETHGAPVPDWDALAARAKRFGITDLLPLLSWNGGAYFPSKVTGYRKTLVETHGDQLEKCLAACRRHGVKCHVWKVNYQIRGSKAMLERMRSEKRLQVIHKGGKTSGPLVESVWLCPSDERNIRLESDAMFEIAGKGVDGIHFDYIRYEGYNGCFCDRCRARFEKMTGRRTENWPADVDAKNAPRAAEWDVFRKGNISALVENVSKRVRAAYPKVEISAAVQSPPPTDMPNGQDWPLWCRNGWLDFVCPMDYTGVSVFLKNIAELQKPVMDATGVPVYPGIGIYSGRSRLDALAAARQIEVLRGLGFPGFTFFSMRADTYPEFEVLSEGPMR